MATTHPPTTWTCRNIVMSAWIIAVFIGLLCFKTAEAAAPPQEVVKNGTDQVLRMLKQHAGDARTRREGIRRVVNEYFDFDEMGKRTLGPHWKTLSPAKQQEFTHVFSQFLFNRYIDGIERYTNERISYSGKDIRGNFARVEATVTGGQEGQISLEYHLLLKNGNWKVYDVVIEGVDLVDNYRSQFASILNRSSFDDLLARLREKNAAHAECLIKYCANIL